MSSPEHVAEPTSWEMLPTTQKAKQWEALVPGTAVRILKETERHMKHVRFMAWAKLCTGAAALLLVSGLSKYYLDHNAPTQGAAIFGSAAAIAGVFVTGQIVIRAKSKTTPP